MPRLLLLTPDFPPSLGGIQVVMARLVTHLEGFTTTVVTRRSPQGPALEDLEELRVRRSGDPAGGAVRSLARFSIASIVHGLRRPPDVLLAGHVVAAPAAFVIGKALRIPYALYVHADEICAYPRLSRFGVRHAARVICVSEHAAALARSVGAHAGQITTIPPGVDIPPPAASREGAVPDRPNGAPPTMLTVARLRERYKGHDIILAALPDVQRAVPRVCWVVVGDGPLRPELEAQARASASDGAVTFTGAVSDARRDALMAAADVFVMPSRLPPGEGGEGFGIVFLEAAAHGLPVIAGNIGGALDAVVDGVTGMLVDPESPNAVGAAVTQLLLDPERARRMGEEGRRRAASFTWPNIAARVAVVLNELLADESS